MADEGLIEKCPSRPARALWIEIDAIPAIWGDITVEAREGLVD